MASKLMELKEKHTILVRNAIRTVAHLQALMEEDATPERVKAVALACLELLDRGLLGQDVEDERVVIEVWGGKAYVTAKTPFVNVDIVDKDHDCDPDEFYTA